jgi:hypothetical protein
VPQRLIHVPLQQIGAILEEIQMALAGGADHPDIPAVEPTLGLIGQALLDRTFTVLTSALTAVPSAEEIRTAVAEATLARDLFEAEGWLDDPAAYHRDPPPVGLREPETTWTWDGPRFRRYGHLRFPSGFEPRPGQPGAERWLEHPSNATAHAYVLEHADPRPWVVCVHGFATGSALVDFTSFNVKHLHEELGLNLAFPVLPLHGPRGTARLSGRELLQPDYMRLVHLFTHAVWDVRRVTSWVRERGATSIGLYGISLGAYVAALAASLCDDFDGVIAGLPPADFVQLARDNQPWFMRRYESQLGPDWQLIRELTRPVSPLALQPRVAPERRFIYAGLVDRVVHPHQARSLWEHWGRPEIHWFAGGHVLGFWHESLAAFLSRSLASSGFTGGGGPPALGRGPPKASTL